MLACFARGPAIENEKQHALGIGAALDQPREALDQRAGLAGAGRARHQQTSFVALEHVAHRLSKPRHVRYPSRGCSVRPRRPKRADLWCA